MTSWRELSYRTLPEAALYYRRWTRPEDHAQDALAAALRGLKIGPSCSAAITNSSPSERKTLMTLYSQTWSDVPESKIEKISQLE